MHVNEKRFAGLRDAAMLSAPVGARGRRIAETSCQRERFARQKYVEQK